MKALRHITVALLVVFLFSGCKKSAKSPAMLKSLPAGAQILFQLDARALVATYGSVLDAASGLVPEKDRQDIPSWEQVVAKVREPTGIDLNQIGQILAASYFDTKSGAPQRMAVIVEGLLASDLKGAETGEHLGKKLYHLNEEKKLHYAQLDPKHIAAAESQESLITVLDTHSGKEPGLTGSNPMLDRLQRVDPAFGQMRVYLLTGDLPGLEKSPVKVKGGGFFVNMQKGFSAAIIGDPEDLGKLKLMAEMGLMQAKNRMTGWASQASPENLQKLDPAMKMASEFVGGIKLEQDGEQLTFAYKGDHPPMMMVGVMAAVAIPAFVTYIRKSKLSEIHMNLDRCYREVLDYYDRPQVLADGTTRSSIMPKALAQPICPGDRTIETLDSKARLFDTKLFGEKGQAQVFSKIGLVFPEKSFACYQLTVEMTGDKAGVQGFTCHAWTDLDDDDQPAHWTKKGIYQKETSSFQAGHVWHDLESDDW